MSVSGTVKAVCVSSAKGERKTPVDTVAFLEGHGIEGDAHAGNWHRQVSLLAAEDIDTLRAKGLPDLASGDFAENVVLSGLELSTLGLGSRLRIGSDVEIAFTQIGKVCHTRCAIYYQTGDCIMPRLGVFARVIRGGSISIDDEVTVLESVPREALQCVVLTVSDRCSSGENEDTAGLAVAAQLRNVLNGHVYAQETLPEEKGQIEERLEHYCSGHSIDLVCTVGGTDLAQRDVTAEAVAAVIERPSPGLDEAMRAASLKTSQATLPRAVSGIRESTLVISLPGSEREATERLRAVQPALEHGLKILRENPSERGRS